MGLPFAPPEDIAAPAFLSTARSHVGHVRKINEDRVMNCPERGLWAIADGMGGHHGGDVAAEMVIAALRQLARRPEPIGQAMIVQALQDANAEILERGRQCGGVIGSTAVVLLVEGDRCTVFWAGDSRAYLCVQGEWAQITRDHSMVQQLVDAGLIDGDQAMRHPKAHVITRALGISADLEIAQISRQVFPGSRLMLSSDGLTRMYEPHAISPETDIDVATDALLAEALRCDGSDNVSLIMVEMPRSS